jgi:hypothetical protein
MSIQPRQSLIAVGLLLAAALALAACGGGSGNSGEEASQTPATTTSPPAGQADPLEGEWRAEFTCRESVRAVKRRLSAAQIHAQATRERAGGALGILKRVLRAIGGKWSDAEPTKDDPCHGAPGKVALVARFADGNLALFDGGGELGLQARYKLVGDQAISVEAEDLCAPSCPRWTFEIAGGELTFRLHPPIAYGVSSWEAAPWVRVS